MNIVKSILTIWLLLVNKFTGDGVNTNIQLGQDAGKSIADGSNGATVYSNACRQF